MIIKTSNVPIDLLDVTRDAVQFYVDTYFTARTKKRMDTITIAFRKFTGDELAMASCEDNEGRLPVEFLVEFSQKHRDIPVREYLITLFHEMTHIHQYATGRLKNRHLYCMWEGERWGYEDKDYWDLPWELEAMSIETGAYVKFFEARPAYDLGRWKPTYLGRKASGWVAEPKAL
ncbi:hypothetical protein AAY80_057 [Stenotrophomonas phage vB_SmaS-DLP_6]|nr:hypothetical protein AAY80_057 [Stenotrophomonas phage vB_SmaS-DLP_6]